MSTAVNPRGKYFFQVINPVNNVFLGRYSKVDRDSSAFRDCFTFTGVEVDNFDRFSRRDHDFWNGIYIIGWCGYNFGILTKSCISVSSNLKKINLLSQAKSSISMKDSYLSFICYLKEVFRSGRQVSQHELCVRGRQVCVGTGGRLRGRTGVRAHHPALCFIASYHSVSSGRAAPAEYSRLRSATVKNNCQLAGILETTFLCCCF